MAKPSLVEVPPHRKKNPLDDIDEVKRFRHFSARTEQTYLNLVKRVCIFYKMLHTRKMAIPEIGTFLFHLPLRGISAGRRETKLLTFSSSLRLQPCPKVGKSRRSHIHSRTGRR
jgi:hypothetical protein